MMFCCEKCFKDSHIKRLFKDIKQKGKCDCCHSDDVSIISLDQDSDIMNCLLELLDIYKPSGKIRGKHVEESLFDDWNIFSINKAQIKKLIRKVCIGRKVNSDILSNYVIIPQLHDKDFLSEYSVTGGLSWSEFADYIKNVNRFHIDFNAVEFSSYLSSLVNVFPKGTVFYRGRIAKTKSGYNTDEMMAPKDYRPPGRVNPEGMLVLYLALEPQTVLYEIRANMYDFISIGKFEAQRDIRIVNISGFDDISPFDYIGGIEKYVANFKIFQDMAREIARPLRKHDSSLEYLPTQYITEFIKREKYDGVGYKSTISNNGTNVALFDETLVKCVDVKTKEVTNIEYKMSYNK